MGFSKPPAGVSTDELFDKVAGKLSEMMSRSPVGMQLSVGTPLLNVAPTDQQWEKLHELYVEFMKDYQLRREMLLKRIDVTILSFTVIIR